jgi:hypothetical protein
VATTSGPAPQPTAESATIIETPVRMSLFMFVFLVALAAESCV